MTRTEGRLHVKCVASILLTVYCLFGVTGPAGAGESDPTGPLPSAPATRAENVFTGPPGELEQSLEATHKQIEQSILEQVQWIDDFFGNPGTTSRQQTSYELRWRNGLRMTDQGAFRPESILRAHLTLPRTSERLQLFISGEDQADQPSTTLPGDPGTPGFDRTNQPTARVVNAEFRYGFLNSPIHDMFVGAGVRIALPLKPVVRTRYQFTHTFSPESRLRAGETLFSKYNDWLGETTEITLEQLLSPRTLLRWANSGTISQEFKGLEWGTELSLAHEFSPHTAITGLGGVYGATRSTAAIANYRVLARFRRNVLTDWLFYELEPEVSWPQDATGAQHPRYALTLRLEVVFKKIGGSTPPARQ